MSRHLAWSLTLVYTGPIVSMALLEFLVQLLMLTVEPLNSGFIFQLWTTGGSSL